MGEGIRLNGCGVPARGGHSYAPTGEEEAGVVSDARHSGRASLLFYLEARFRISLNPSLRTLPAALIFGSLNASKIVRAA